LRLTPKASGRTHLLAAGLLWSLVGLGLFCAGVIWMARAESSWFVPVLLAAAVVTGVAKARFVLDRRAREIVRRIEERGDGRCLGGFLSWKSWLAVAAMAALGQVFRASSLPALVRGAICLAVGLALLIASRLAWMAWIRRTRWGPRA